MGKVFFKYEDNYGDITEIKRINIENIDDMRDVFVQFLKGISYKEELIDTIFSTSKGDE